MWGILKGKSVKIFPEEILGKVSQGKRERINGGRPKKISREHDEGILSELPEEIFEKI